MWGMWGRLVTVTGTGSGLTRAPGPEGRVWVLGGSTAGFGSLGLEVLSDGRRGDSNWTWSPGDASQRDTYPLVAFQQALRHRVVTGPWDCRSSTLPGRQEER